MGGIVGIIRIHRRVGRRWIWSYLVIGSVSWPGAQLASPAAFAAEDPVVAAPAPAPLASGEPLVPSARVAGVSEPSPARGGWSFAATGAVDLSFTDNVYLTETNRLSDFIVSPRGSFTARRSTGRTLLNANAEVAYDYYTKNTRLNGARPSALIDGFVEVIENTFTLDGRVATDVQQISSEDRVPAIQRNLDRNQTQILNYGITPTLRGRFGGGVSAEAQYDYSAVNFLDPPVDPTTGAGFIQGSDTRRHTGRARIGMDEAAVAPLLWSVGGSYERSHVDSLVIRQPERGNAEGRVEYRVSAPLALVARGGNDWIKEPTLLTSPDGAYGLVGVVWRPSQRTLLRADAGYRYRDFNAELDAQYAMSRAINLSASYRRDIQTGGRVLLDSLAGLGRDESGNLVDPISGLPPDPNSTRFGLTDQAFKRDQFRIGVHGQVQRNFYSLAGDYEHRDANGLGGKSWGLSAAAGRDLTPRLQASASVAYAKTTGDPGLAFGIRNSRATSAGARLDYRMTRTMRATARYAHTRRSTTLVRYHENALILSVSNVF
ncbi:MAG: TIGR03016 family PEP-CTERM system-associated outer membrane protein [Rhodospirillaceae bacterium]